MKLRVTGIVFLAGLLLASLTYGQFFRFDPPSPWQLTGVLDQKPEEARVLEEVEIGVAGGKTRTLYVTRYRRLDSGNPWILFRDVNMRHPDFLLRGSQETLERFEQAPAGSTLKGTFYHRTGGQTLLAEPTTFSISGAHHEATN